MLSGMIKCMSYTERIGVRLPEHTEPGWICSMQRIGRIVENHIRHIRSFVSVHHDTCVIGVNWDITENIEAERIKSLCDIVVCNKNDAVATTSVDTIITSWNRGAQQLFGFTPAEIIGQPIDILLPKDSVKPVLEGAIVEYTAETVKKDLKPIHVRTIFAPLRDGVNNIIGTSMLSRNVTKEIEADTLKSEYISLASHQLRSPLASIKSLSELLLTDGTETLSLEHQQ